MLLLGRSLLAEEIRGHFCHRSHILVAASEAACVRAEADAASECTSRRAMISSLLRPNLLEQEEADSSPIHI